jgi:hypothetical protein
MNNRSLKLSGADEEFFINELVTNKILNSEPIPQNLISLQKYDDIFLLLEKINELREQRKDAEISTSELFEQTQSILNENTHIPLIEQIKFFVGNIEEKYLFLIHLCNFFDGERYMWVEKTFKEIYDRQNERFGQIQKFLTKDNNLIQEDWLELEEAAFFDDAKMRLTEKALNLLDENGIKLFNKSSYDKKKDKLILPGDIAVRNLIYNSQESDQIELLKKLLSEENLKITKDRLKEKSLPTGITALLHGAPGTGKTESVLQIAKATNREIWKVDISSSRSMWFGESEKIIKNVFNDYKSYAKKQKLCPILFFNEADAIISKRKEGGQSNVSDTENRIQNILLEEIENFDGILIATTNLATNMDTAFDRRFLFKIEFIKPTAKVKAQIWKDKLPYLSDEDCDNLASHFNFSGGQIDNIARKMAISEIIHGTQYSIDALFTLCTQEILSVQNKRSEIGFNLSGFN